MPGFSKTNLHNYKIMLIHQGGPWQNSMKTNANIFPCYNITNKMQSVSVYKERVQINQWKCHTSKQVLTFMAKISQFPKFCVDITMAMLIMIHYIWFVSECCDYWWKIASLKFGHQAITDQNLHPAWDFVLTEKLSLTPPK